jgi:hypothetical protein
MQLWALARSISITGESLRYGYPEHDDSPPSKLRENRAIGDHFFSDHGAPDVLSKQTDMKGPCIFAVRGFGLRGRRKASLGDYSKISRKLGGCSDLSPTAQSTQQLQGHKCTAIAVRNSRHYCPFGAFSWAAATVALAGVIW